MAPEQSIGPIKKSCKLKIRQVAAGTETRQKIDRIEETEDLSLTQVSLISLSSAETDNQSKKNNKTISTWNNGLFYLFVFIVVIAGLGVLANVMPLYTLIIIVVAGMLFVPLIGVLELRRNAVLSEKSFTDTLKAIIKQLSLFEKFVKHKPPP